MSRDRIFFSIIFGFALAIAFSSFFNLGIIFAMSLAVIALFLFVLFFVEYKLGFEKNFSKQILIATFLLASSFGVLRMEFFNKGNVGLLGNYVNDSVKISGEVSAPPTEKENGLSFVLESESISFYGKTENIKDNIQVFLRSGRELKYGQKIIAGGKLALPENFTPDGGREFDYKNYLEKKGIHYILENAYLDNVAIATPSFVGSLYAIKNAFSNSVKRNIGGSESALANGILFGEKGISNDLNDVFRTVGIIHIIVLSGYNITIVAESVIKILGFLPRVFASFGGAIGIILFSIAVGGGATVIRASAMALIAIFARETGRVYDASRALMVAGFLMILFDPSILVFDISFALSFMATLALILVSPIIEKHAGFITERFGLREVVVSTVSTQIFVFPLLAYYMGQFSIISFVVNLLVLPFIPFAMLISFITSTLGLISTWLALPFGLISKIVLGYVIWIAKTFSLLPFAKISILGFGKVLLVGFYLVYGVLIVLLRDKDGEVKKDN